MNEQENTIAEEAITTVPAFSITDWAEPEYSDWQWSIGNLFVRPEKGDEPNRFQRWMLTKFMGIKWEKVG